jgi:hypothetical protein
MYTNMPIVDASRPHPYGDTPSPKRFGTVSPLDPQLFARVDDYAEALIRGEPTGKHSPVEVAQWMDDLAETAMGRLHEAESQIADRNSPVFKRLAVDVAIQSGLGRFFAAKLRAGVLYAIHDRTADPKALEEALKAYRAARSVWTEMATRAQDVYVRDITFGLEKQLRGHWLDRLAAVDEDIADMEKRAQSRRPEGQTTISPAAIARAIQVALGRVQRPVVPLAHVVPPPFRAGQPVTVELALLDRQPPIAAIRLYYRQVHQVQSYQTADMPIQGNRCSAIIPGEYTNSPYPLEYYFELRDVAQPPPAGITPEGGGATREAGRAWLYPGFDATLANQPYFVVRQAYA